MTIPVSETVLLITRKGMGDAEPALQQKLITTYFKLLDENNLLPAAICFYAEGVHLAVAGLAGDRLIEIAGSKRRAPGIMQHLPTILSPGGQSASRHCRRDDGHHRGPIPGW